MKIPDRKLSDNFWLSELCKSETATRMGVDNTPPDHVIANMIVLANNLEVIRGETGGCVVDVSSGYRCEAVNSAIGSKPGSSHTTGCAADFVIRGYGDPLKVAQLVERLANEGKIALRQVIHEYGGWCHYDWGDKAPILPINRVITIGHQGTRPGLLPARPKL